MSLTQATRECRCDKPNLVDHGIDFLDTLPPELLTNILGRLDYKAVLRCSSLSQKWSKIANCPHLVSELFFKFKPNHLNSGPIWHYN